jgi:hypothetical protein
MVERPAKNGVSFNRKQDEGKRVPKCPEASQAGYEYAMEPEATEGISVCRAGLGED